MSETIRAVLLAGDEAREGRAALDDGEAGVEVGLEAERALIALLGGLREELHDDGGERLGDRPIDEVRGHRDLGDVAMDELHGVVRREGQAARGELVEGHPQRVEVGPVVDRPVHAAGLLGRDVPQGPLEGVDVADGGALAGEHRREREVGDLGRPRGGIDDDVAGLDVAVDDARAVQGAEGLDDLAGDPQGLGEVEVERGVGEEPGQRPAGVLHDERHVAGAGLEVEQPDHARDVEAAGDLVLALDHRDAARAVRVALRQLDDAGQTVFLAAAEVDVVRPLVDPLDDLILRKLNHPDACSVTPLRKRSRA